MKLTDEGKEHRQSRGGTGMQPNAQARIDQRPRTASDDVGGNQRKQNDCDAERHHSPGKVEFDETSRTRLNRRTVVPRPRTVSQFHFQALIILTWKKSLETCS
jgi:hypothetical protein